MPQWGNTDNTANSVLWGVSQLKLPANTANRDALFGNTTPDAFINGQTTGVFGLDTTEIGVSNNSVAAYEVTFTGSGYTANAAVTVEGNATANATANSTGRISAVNIVLPGNSYTTTAPAVTVAAPATITFSANSTSVIVGNSTVNGFITLGTNTAFLANNDIVNYRVPAANTAVGGLANNSNYFVIVANSTAIQLAATASGPAINLASVGTGAQPHTLQGQAAAAVATLSGVKSGAAHVGWVLRTVGEGGRAGRVQYETLVAMSGISGDAEDTILKDA